MQIGDIQEALKQYNIAVVIRTTVDVYPKMDGFIGRDHYSVVCEDAEARCRVEHWLRFMQLEFVDFQAWALDVKDLEKERDITTGYDPSCSNNKQEMTMLRGSYRVEIRYSDGSREQRGVCADTPDSALHALAIAEEEHRSLWPDRPHIISILSIEREIYEE